MRPALKHSAALTIMIVGFLPLLFLFWVIANYRLHIGWAPGQSAGSLDALTVGIETVVAYLFAMLVGVPGLAWVGRLSPLVSPRRRTVGNLLTRVCIGLLVLPVLVGVVLYALRLVLNLF